MAQNNLLAIVTKSHALWVFVVGTEGRGVPWLRVVGSKFVDFEVA